MMWQMSAFTVYNAVDLSISMYIFIVHM